MAHFNSHHTLLLCVGILGNILSLFVFLAPMPTFYRVYKKKTTEGFQSVPYVMGLFSAMLWTYYGVLKSGAILLMTINSFGCLIQSLYLLIYLIYAPKNQKMAAARLCGAMNIGFFSLVIAATLFLFKGPNRIQVLGWVCASMSVAVFASPLSVLASVIRTKSMEFVPLNLSFFLTVSAVTWFCYGILLGDLYIAAPNVVGMVVGMLQTVLYGMYRGRRHVEMKTDEEKATVVDTNCSSTEEGNNCGGGEEGDAKKIFEDRIASSPCGVVIE